MKMYHAAAAMALMASAACASTRMPPVQLTDARQAVNHAKDSEGSELVLVDLHNAEVALNRAEKSWNDGDDNNPRTSDLAYIAQRKAETAEVRGQTALAKVKVADAQKDMLKHHSQTAEQRNQELSKVQGKLNEAQARASEAADKLQKREGRSVKQESRGTVISIADNVLFESNAANLLPAAKDHLDDIAAMLMSAKGRKVSVAGHTDSTGKNAHNDMLSQHRAEAVMQFLVNKGLPANEISIAAHGSSKPLADNARREGRAANRRVEIIVHAETDAPQKG